MLLKSIDILIIYLQITIKNVKKIFFYLIVITSLAEAQPDFKINREMIQSGNFFNAEIHAFPGQNGYDVYYSYKIPYSQLFFQKQNGTFLGGLKVNLEIKNDDGSFIKREFDERKIILSDFEETNSRQLFLTGIIHLTLSQSNYKVSAVIIDITSKRERKLPPTDFKVNDSIKILDPVVIEPQETSCDSVNYYTLVNNSSAIPFNKPKSQLIIPVTDTTVNSLHLKFSSTGNEVEAVSKQLTEGVITGIEIKECEGKLLFANSKKNDKIKYFVFPDVAAKLDEGVFELEIIPNDSEKDKNVFKLNSIWIGKPFALRDPQEAVNILKYIEDDKMISELLDNNKDYQSALNAYWAKFDPTPDTKYNELMDEFFRRVDYSEMHFRSIGGDGGSKSDRGKIYLKFGEPDSIERYNDSYGKVIESWYYKISNKKYLFVDKNGTGTYTLVEK